MSTTSPITSAGADRGDEQLVPAGVPEQLAGQVGGPAGGLLDRPQERPVRVVGPEPDQRQVAEHGGQQVVEVVGHPAGQLADRLHLLGLPELLLQLPPLGHVHRHAEPVHEFPPPGRGRPSPTARSRLPPVRPDVPLLELVRVPTAGQQVSRTSGCWSGQSSGWVNSRGWRPITSGR